MKSSPTFRLPIVAAITLLAGSAFAGSQLRAPVKISGLNIEKLVADWDDDGDLDLLFGGYRGTVGVRLNEGTASEPAFAPKFSFVEAGGSKLAVSGGNGPAYVDWDGDGLRDLVCASAKGEIVWFRNSGEKGAPEFAKAETLAEKSGDRPSSYLKLDVDDYNGDGKLDLIVGANDGSRKPAIWVYLRN